MVPQQHEGNEENKTYKQQWVGQLKLLCFRKQRIDFQLIRRKGANLRLIEGHLWPSLESWKLLLMRIYMKE